MKTVISNFGDPVVYWTLILFLYAILFITGYKIKECRCKEYWRICIPAIIAYTIIEGLRYGRGVDFFHYAYDLEEAAYVSYSEWLYLFWITLYQKMSLPYYWGFMLYSALFIIGFLAIGIQFKKCLWITLPLMFCITQPNTENLIRQCLAGSFIMMGYAAYLKDKWLLTFFLMVIAPFIHTFALFPLAVFALCLIPKIPFFLSRFPWVYPFIYIVTYLFWDISLFDNYISYIQLIDLGTNSMQQYIDNANIRLTDSSNLIHNLTGSVIYEFIKLLFSCYVLYVGSFIIKNNPKYTFLYIATFLTFFFSVFSCGIEIWERFGFIFEFSVPFILGYIIINRTENKYINCTYWIFLVYLYFYPVVIRIGSSSYVGCGFIWDK